MVLTMRNYVVKTRLSANEMKVLYWICRDYWGLKSRAICDDELTRDDAQRKIDAIDWCFEAVGCRDDISGETIRALRENICSGIGYEKMKHKPPCGINQFYKLRREFFVRLNEKLKGG